MINSSNHIFNNVDIKLDLSEYYDFILSNDNSDVISEYNILVNYDFNSLNIYEDESFKIQRIYSLDYWNDAVNNGVTLENIGFVGLDNGLLYFEKNPNDYANTGLTEVLTGTVLEIISGEKRLILSPVTGYTNNFIYPMEIETSNVVGNYLKLCGGFYQGFYKLYNYDYEVIPNRYSKGWTVDFWLNLSGETICTYSGQTVNDVYPDNSGFFFYLGTRAENKFWNIFNGLNTDDTYYCGSGATEWCTVLKETDILTTTKYPLSPPPIKIEEIDNQFLIYSRATGHNRCNPNGKGVKGETVYTFKQGDKLIRTGTTMVKVDFRNPFLIYSRATGHNRCNPNGKGVKGETVYSYSGDSIPLLELDYNADLYDNAIGYRITPDGRIGYRALRMGCFSGESGLYSGITVEEAYSYSGVVRNNQWTYVTIKYLPDYVYDKCKLLEYPPRNGKLFFYVNGRLKLVIDNVREIIPRNLNEYFQKQEGVPYNISIGGGSLGLLESMTFDGQDPKDLGLIIEKYFAGTFIGGISRFRFYDQPLNWCEIKSIYETEAIEFGLSIIPEHDP